MLTNKNNRRILGQYMTPPPTARFLASMFKNLSGELHLLDAGAGVGALSAAFIERILDSSDCKNLFVEAFEIDPNLQINLIKSLESYKPEMARSRVKYNFRCNILDFIENSVNRLTDKETCSKFPKFNRVILNPPYVKIAAKSDERKLLESVGIETGNLYSAFVILSLRLMESGGELVAITPRSFCNGPHFKKIRKELLNKNYLSQIHLFDSRDNVFKDDKVLQENVVFHIIKDRPQEEVQITSSTNATSRLLTSRIVSFTEVVDPSCQDRFIHLVTDDRQATVARLIKTLPCTLTDLGLNVSTGKVVDFRTKSNLRAQPQVNTVPLIFPLHFSNGQIKWPIQKSKKPNAILKNASTERLLIENGTYVLIKRFTSKEERRRIIASLYTPKLSQVSHVGFDNKINYFHENGSALSPNIAKGLTLFLNSTIVDEYFRQFSGHTQVNVADLKILRYPNLEQLASLGDVGLPKKFTQSTIDQLINDIIFS